MKTSFKEILSNNQIVIPIIQRDYAQGRNDEKTSKIRKDFLGAIFEILKQRIITSSDRSLELDFIYGFNTLAADKSTFAPIDGQQRLTTLWLLYWYISVKEKDKVSTEQKQMLANFRYETRHSTAVFCEQLIHFIPTFKYKNIVEEITNQSWYFEAWNFDPSIRAMLVMLNEIEQKYNELNSDEVWDIINHDQNPFYLYRLDMEKVGLPDDLYIKMNSRGKPLTEFEYFKASFLEIIKSEDLKKRFETSIDQKWAECIWTIVHEKFKNDSNIDLALLVDDCFMRLLNFISDVLAYKQRITFKDINHSIEETNQLYRNEDNLIFLFDVLDSIVDLQKDKPSFWANLFYTLKNDFGFGKTRIFFLNSNINLLEKCLFNYEKSAKGFSYPEQLLLYACLTHLLNNTNEFNKVARIIRNLVANSENELRDATIGLSFSEIEEFVQSVNFGQLEHFKSDQISEEKEKYDFLNQNYDFAESVFKLEDSDILRGCISIFDLDDKLENRTRIFLNLFDEDIVNLDFVNRSNLLLCFGDYSQNDGDLTNLLASAKGIWRKFLTTPAYNKLQLTSKTKLVLIECVDFFDANPSTSIEQKIEETLKKFDNSPKNWIYYFLRYPHFRNSCNKGYYYWNHTNPYPIFKMKERQFNGYHWDPFLLEVKEQVNSDKLKLDIGGDMQMIIGSDMLQIKSQSNGFLVDNKNESNSLNITYDKLIEDETITPNGLLVINQNTENIDLENRVEIGVAFINAIINKQE
jgi:hypothetical protein